MKKISLLILLLTFSTFVVSMAESNDILSAFKAKKVSLKLIGNGGFNGPCLQMTIKNTSNTKQDIRIPPGLIFECTDENSQDLMNVEGYLLALMPGITKSLDLQTVCIKQHLGSPSKSVLFALNGKATGNLLAIAELIAAKKFHNSTAQSAVWAITDGADLSSIYAEDTLMARELASFVSEATGRPMPKIIPAKEHYIYGIKMNITHHFSNPTKVTLACYKEDGTKIKEYYKDRLIPMGMYIASFSINETADKGTKFIFRLTDESGTIIKERTITETINEEKASKWRLDVAFSYVLKEALTSSTMKLIDDKGMLMEVVYANRALPAGGRNQKYSFHHAYGKDATFYLRLFDDKGKMVMEQKLDGSKSINIPY